MFDYVGDMVLVLCGSRTMTSECGEGRGEPECPCAVLYSGTGGGGGGHVLNNFSFPPLAWLLCYATRK